MAYANDFYSERDMNERLGIDSADSLWEWIEAGATDGIPAAAWKLTTGKNLFFRGQPNSTYNLSSSLYRLCHSICKTAKKLPVAEDVMRTAEVAIIDAAKGEGLGRNMTQGQLLMVLQHHGIPTRLVDVSAGAPEGLYFAVDQQDSKDGRLFILHPHDDKRLSLELNDELPWADASVGTSRAKAEWTDSVSIIEQAPLDPRMQAQKGRFLVGGLAKRYAGSAMRTKGSPIPAAEYFDITTLSVNFLKNTTGGPSARWRATGWTILIKAEWKERLRDLLASMKDPISKDRMYPPVTEVERLAKKVAKDSLKGLF
jgi:hypothetical protein